jgi:hypothetical protein
MTDEELTKQLRDLSAGPSDEMQRIGNKAADRIQQLTAKLKLLEKVDMYLKTSYPDKSGSYFICGEGGVKDDNGLPERLHVCPAYGSDWMMLYTRTDKTHGPEY